MEEKFQRMIYEKNSRGAQIWMDEILNGLSSKDSSYTYMMISNMNKIRN